MPRSQQAKLRKKQIKKKRLREREKRNRELSPPRLSRKLSERVERATQLIEEGRTNEAREILEAIDQQARPYHEVLEVLLVIAQRERDHIRGCQLARRLAKLRPRDPDARLMYAQESMHCGRATVALANYREFLERWPQHSHAPNVEPILSELEKECDARIQKAGFPGETGFSRQLLHETSLEFMEQHLFAECATTCLELLELEPQFASARNNLAIARFQEGRWEEGIAFAEETLQLAPENSFTKAMLGKFYFVGGFQEKAAKLTDTLLVGPPRDPDGAAAVFELLALLGRDRELAAYCETMDEESTTEQEQANRLHFAVYANHRLGENEVANRYRRAFKALKEGNAEAEENLKDLENGEGHAPWPLPLGNWVPRSTLDTLMDQTQRREQRSNRVLRELVHLIAPLLDRGDPFGREFAMRLAMADGSPQMLDALKVFALGARGPDKMRMDALLFLKERNALGDGPHKVYSRGKWTTIQLLSAEIYSEAEDSNSCPEVVDLMTDGVQSMHDGDYDRAESCFENILRVEPTNTNAIYNRCAVWMHRDGPEGVERARPEIERLHQEVPDYTFARVAVAQFASEEGRHQDAREILAPIYRQARLHVTEAIALFSAQADICLASDDFAGVETAIAMLSQLSGEDDPRVMHFKHRMSRDSGSLRSALQHLLKRA